MLADFVFNTAIPFRVIDSEEFKIFCKFLKPAYDPMSAKVCSTSMLNLKYNDLKNKISEKIATATEISIISDGRSNLKNESIINYILSIAGG